MVLLNGAQRGFIISTGIFDRAVHDLVATARGARGSDFDTAPRTVFIQLSTENHRCAGRAFHQQHTVRTDVHIGIVRENNLRALIHFHHILRRLQIDTLIHIVGNALVAEADGISITFIIKPIAIHFNHIVSIVGISVAIAEGIQQLVIPKLHRELVHILDGIILECSQSTARNEAISQSPVDGAMFHGEFTRHIDNGSFSSAVIKGHILKLVVSAIGIHPHVAPGALVRVIGGAREDNGFVGRAHHTQTGVLTHRNAAVNTCEHDGHTGFDSQQGVAFHPKTPVNDVIDSHATVGPGGVGADAAGNFQCALSATTATARSVAERSDEFGIAAHQNLTRIFGVAVVPTVEEITLCGNSGNGDRLAVLIGTAAGNNSPSRIVGFHRNGVTFLTARHGKNHQKSQCCDRNQSFHFFRFYVLI